MSARGPLSGNLVRTIWSKKIELGASRMSDATEQVLRKQIADCTRMMVMAELMDYIGVVSNAIIAFGRAVLFFLSLFVFALRARKRTTKNGEVPSLVATIT